MAFKSKEHQAAVMMLLKALGVAAMMGAAGAVGSEAGSHMYTAARTKAAASTARRQKYRRLQRIRAKHTAAAQSQSRSSGGSEYVRGPFPRGA